MQYGGGVRWNKKRERNWEGRGEGRKKIEEKEVRVKV